MSNNREDFNVIYTYTRKEAIADGLQVCISDLYPDDCSRLYKYPVYFTSSVMALMSNYKDKGAVVWDILFMSAKSSMRRELSPSLVEFSVIVEKATRKPDFKEEGLNAYTLLIQVGPTDFDNPEPAITVMFPEDN